ncbi:phage terminase small subunit [Bacillus toyonensis]|uniref:phage terminase small subunit n=1 Tax=Bacillus toyonensis TaxID=155322 RepID=UPI000BF5D607|nr:phage terminase small subunit [Bacillus toyonensis]PFY36877.1 hypothetical protein COL55_28375 [Bacillus toyonensis]PFY43862.1 hypothetical protein COL54_12535 [Bacillus toyonensis]PFY73563.1 hypothetical protein COL62_24300 [Bacillus toyonensis]PHA42885.1 hypothetical protein COE68_17995 [Bacillus toyonensis]PHG01196.1 hypothetical protein COI63_25320 [Bacillus toyonensis]
MKQKHELAQEDYMQGMKYKELAEKYEVSINTIKSWRKRHGWNRKRVHPNDEKGCTQTKKTGAPIGNKNAVGNSGNKNPKWGNKNAVGHGAPLQNDNAVTHGFFRKHFPEDVADLAAEIMEKNPIDMLWENITIQYTAIIRAQRLMFVVDQEDTSREVKKETDMGTEYEIQFAWDKHANFLNAQSRAMSTLSSLIKDFDKLANIDDERRLKLEGMKLNVKKVEAEVKKLSGNGNDGLIEIIVKRKGDD